jgi:extradiol dioxygenase family protein
MLNPFHLAIPVSDLKTAEHFYGSVLACEKGRSDASWIDWNFFGHQLVTHLVEKMPNAVPRNSVDSKDVPVPHFGVVLNKENWRRVISLLETNNIQFELAPYIRFEGKTGEQGTVFIFDPAGTALEFKYFNDFSQVFAV